MSISVSVIVGTRNRVDTLRRCVDALAAVNTRHTWELIIVDNASDDGTSAFLASLPTHFGNANVIVTYESKLGSAAARNKGISLARGNILAFTDDDCYVAKDYIDAMISAFESNPEIGFVGGRILLYDQTDLPSTINESEDYLFFQPRTFVPAGAIQGANMAFRRTALERTGGFDTDFGAGTSFCCEDIDAVAAALWAGIAGAYDPRPTVYHHHGRKTKRDARDLWYLYDRARGAYYAKYILRRDTRSKYFKSWMRTIKNGIINGRRTVVKEATSGTFRERFYAIRHSLNELSGALQYVAGRSLIRQSSRD